MVIHQVLSRAGCRYIARGDDRWLSNTAPPTPSPGPWRCFPTPSGCVPPHSHADAGLLAQREPARPLHQLATDPFGNYLRQAGFPEPVKELDITVDVVADMTLINPFDFFLEPYAEYPSSIRQPCRYRSRALPATCGRRWPGRRVRRPAGARVGAAAHHRAYAGLQGDERPRMVDFLVAVNTALQHDAAYVAHGAEPGPRQHPGKALGSCRDSAATAGLQAAARSRLAAVRLRLPGTLALRRRGAGRGCVDPKARTSPTCTPGPGVFVPDCGLDRSRPTPRGCSPARALHSPVARPPVQLGTDRRRGRSGCGRPTHFSNTNTRVHRTPRG